jgi:histidinol phosphatase-like enzyme
MSQQQGCRFIVPDPDGTIIEAREYLSQAGEVTLLSGAGGTLCELQLMGFSLLVITTEGEPL